MSAKYGPKFDKIIDSEILNAINRMQGSIAKGKGSPSVRNGLSLDEIGDKVSRRVFKVQQGSPAAHKQAWELSYAQVEEGAPEADLQVSPKTFKKFGIANAGIPYTMQVKELQNSLMKTNFTGRLSP